MEYVSECFELNKRVKKKGYELCSPPGMYPGDCAIHIGVAFDQNFVTPFYVLLTSIFSSHKENPIHFHVIVTGISKEEKHNISAFIAQHNASVSFYEIQEDLLPPNLPQSKAYPISIYYRLLFPFLIPDSIHRLLYLDTDIVVINSLQSLYQTDIGNLPVGAVIESFVSSRPELGIFEAGRYFNSGVLLINVPQWKEQKITERVLHFLTQHSHKLTWMDQDALNAVLINNYYPLDFKYNLTSEFIPKKLPRKELELFMKDKVIIHYTSGGIKKPWSGLSRNRLRHYYHCYLKKSPHAFQKKYTDFSFSLNYLTLFTKIRLLEFLIDHPGLLRLWQKAGKPLATPKPATEA
jgi:lipopolysaccharide biosynthesis glycosyltransferase